MRNSGHSPPFMEFLSKNSASGGMLGCQTAVTPCFVTDVGGELNEGRVDGGGIKVVN